MIALNTTSGLVYHQAGLSDLKYQEGPWTCFMDMHSGGRTKAGEFEYIYIQMAEEQARDLFFAVFDRSPHNISCDCCGSDYSMSEYPTLEEATKYERTYRRPDGEDIETYAALPEVLVIVTQGHDKGATDACDSQ